MQVGKIIAIIVIVVVFAAGAIAGFYFGGKIDFTMEESESGLNGERAADSAARDVLSGTKVTHRAEFFSPYSVGLIWEDYGGASAVLTKVEARAAEASSDPQILSLFFSIGADRERFCESYLGDVFRLIVNERGDSLPPDYTGETCADPAPAVGGISEVENAEVRFALPPSIIQPVGEDIFVSVLGRNGEQKTFFLIELFPNGTLKVEPALLRG